MKKIPQSASLEPYILTTKFPVTCNICLKYAFYSLLSDQDHEEKSPISLAILDFFPSTTKLSQVWRVGCISSVELPPRTLMPFYDYFFQLNAEMECRNRGGCTPEMHKEISVVKVTSYWKNII